jgi:hypothetical protein
MMNTFIPISNLTFLANETAGFKAEYTGADFTLFKRETTLNNFIFIVLQGHSGSPDTAGPTSSQPVPDLRKPTATTTKTESDSEFSPSLRRAFRLASHVIVDRTTALMPGMSLELADDFYISAHMVEDGEVYFPSWDATHRSLRIVFGSREPVSAGSIQTGQLVPFVNNRAQISERASLAYCRVEPGQTMFFDTPGFAISLAAGCQMALWHIERMHTREISKHYFLLFTRG